MQFSSEIKVIEITEKLGDRNTRIMWLFFNKENVGNILLPNVWLCKVNRDAVDNMIWVQIELKE